MSALATPKTNAQRAIDKYMWSQKANKTFVEHLVKLVALVTEVLSVTPSTIGCVEDSSSVKVLDFYKAVVLGTIKLRCAPVKDNLVADLDNFVKQQVDTAAYEAYRNHFTDIPDYDITTYSYEAFISASAVLHLALAAPTFYKSPQETSLEDHSQVIDFFRAKADAVVKCTENLADYHQLEILQACNDLEYDIWCIYLDPARSTNDFCKTWAIDDKVVKDVIADNEMRCKSLRSQPKLPWHAEGRNPKSIAWSELDKESKETVIKLKAGGGHLPFPVLSMASLDLLDPDAADLSPDTEHNKVVTSTTNFLDLVLDKAATGHAYSSALHRSLVRPDFDDPERYLVKADLKVEVTFSKIKISD
jgi:hypothetical protein